MAFRLRAKNLFLTYPQCPLTKEQCLERLTDTLATLGRGISRIVVGQELHQDGNTHLHVFATLNTLLSSTLPSVLDLSGDQQGQNWHGNYQAAKNVDAAIRYVVKDGNWIARPEGWDPTAHNRGEARHSTLDMVIAAINEGRSLQEMWEEAPSTVLIHKRKIEEMISQRSLWTQVGSLVSIVPILSGPVVMALSGNPLWTWLATNLLQTRKPRQPQLFMWGEPGIGKTRLVTALRRYLRVYDVPQEDFYDMYQDGDFDLAVLDEFKGWKTIQWMNSWLQGTPMCLRKKGSQAMKLKNIPTLVIANRDITSIYRNTSQVYLDALIQRFFMLNATSEILDPVTAALEAHLLADLTHQ